MRFDRAGVMVGGAACVALATIFACSDLDGLTSAGEDAASDAPGPANDAGSDAPDPPDAPWVTDGGLAFCATRDATICDDFEGAAIDVKWSPTSPRGNGVTALSDAGADGSAGSLRASFDAPAPVDAGPSAFLYQRYAGTPSKVACSIDLYVEGSTTGDQVSVLLLGNLDQSTWSGIGLDVAPTSARFWAYGRYPDGGTHGSDALITTVPFQEWVHVEIETDYATGRLRVNGGATNVLSLPTLGRSSYEVAVGVDSDSTGMAAVRIDNVVCDVTP